VKAERRTKNYKNRDVRVQQTLQTVDWNWPRRRKIRRGRACFLKYFYFLLNNDVISFVIGSARRTKRPRRFMIFSKMIRPVRQPRRGRATGTRDDDRGRVATRGRGINRRPTSLPVTAWPRTVLRDNALSRNVRRILFTNGHFRAFVFCMITARANASVARVRVDLDAHASLLSIGDFDLVLCYPSRRLYADNVFYSISRDFIRITALLNNTSLL